MRIPTDHAGELELAIAVLAELELEAIEVMKDYRRRVAAAMQRIIDLRLQELQRLATLGRGRDLPPAA